jgi:hypothetical protein
VEIVNDDIHLDSNLEDSNLPYQGTATQGPSDSEKHAASNNNVARCGDSGKLFIEPQYYHY